MNPNDPILRELRAGDCPGVDALENYRLHPEQNAGVRAHLKDCAACQAEHTLGPEVIGQLLRFMDYVAAGGGSGRDVTAEFRRFCRRRPAASKDGAMQQ